MACYHQDPQPVSATGHTEASTYLFDWLDTKMGDATLVVIGHRIVHGGARYRDHGKVDDELIQNWMWTPRPVEADQR